MLLDLNFYSSVRVAALPTPDVDLCDVCCFLLPLSLTVSEYRNTVDTQASGMSILRTRPSQHAHTKQTINYSFKNQDISYDPEDLC